MKSKITISGLAILSFICVLVSCQREIGNTVFDIDFYFSVKDAKGNNLLDPSTQGYYNKDSIRLYSWKDGVKTELYHHNLTAQRNFEIFQNSNNEYGIKVYAEPGEGNNSQTTTILIQWKLNDDTNVDTVATFINKLVTDNSDISTVDKITYNNTVVWDYNKNQYYSQWGDLSYKRFFQIVKGE